jgi:hypothetical protein
MVVGPVRFSCGKIKAEKLRVGRYTAKKTLIREKRRGQKDSDTLFMAKVFTIPVAPQIGRKRRERTSDPRYVDGQRQLVEAMRYLAQADPVSNREAIELLSEHVRTRFRMTDSPLG